MFKNNIKINDFISFVNEFFYLKYILKKYIKFNQKVSFNDIIINKY